MSDYKKWLCLLVSIFLVQSLKAETQQDTQATAILQAAMDAWRGNSSYSEMTMSIHRPDWQREVSMRGWTRGDKDSLVRVTAPKKDVGTATLTLDNSMWTYSPKVNRVIKVPSSMMSQSWMGSDFTNKDVSKADEILHEYTHTLLRTEQQEGFKVYVIEALPKENAAVVWGKQIIWIREDHIMLREEFYDQDGVLVKFMETLKIEIMDERAVAQAQRMTDAEEENKWTEITVHTIDFNIELKDNLFTLSNLRNPRD